MPEMNQLFHPKTKRAKALQRSSSNKKLTFLLLIFVYRQLARFVHAVTIAEVTPYEVSADVTRESAYYSTDDYVLTSIRLFKANNKDSDFISGIQLGFTRYGNNLNRQYILVGGTTSPSDANPYLGFDTAFPAGDNWIRKVYLCNTRGATIALKFESTSGTTYNSPNIDFDSFCDPSESYWVSLNGNFSAKIRGFAFQRTSRLNSA